jgi:hypothetical protein
MWGSLYTEDGGGCVCSATGAVVAVPSGNRSDGTSPGGA